MWTALFRVVLLPRRVVLAEHLSPAEAMAFLRGYEEAKEPSAGSEAVIIHEDETASGCRRRKECRLVESATVRKVRRDRKNRYAPSRS